MTFDPEAVRKALAEQPSGMLRLEHVEGGHALVSRTVAEALVSTRPGADSGDVDVIFEGAVRVRVVQDLVRRGEIRAAHADVTDAAGIAELCGVLRVRDTGLHRMSPCDLALEVSGPEGLRARLGVIDLELIRWPERWRTDAQITGGSLGRWIAKHGSDAPLRAAQQRAVREAEDARASRVALEPWRAAMPPCIRSLWPEVVDDEEVRMGRSDMDIQRLVAAIHEALPAAEDRARALLGWASVPEGAGKQYSALTLIQLRLTREVLSDEDLERLLAESPSNSLVEGTVRLLWWIRSWHQPRTVRAKRRAKEAYRALEERLTAACPALHERLGRR